MEGHFNQKIVKLVTTIKHSKILMLGIILYQ